MKIAAILALAASLLVPLAGSAAVHTEFRLRNTTSFVAQFDVVQLSPMARTLGYVVNPRRTETRYLTEPMGRFEIRGIAYVGGVREKLTPVEIAVRPGSIVTVVLDDVDGTMALSATSSAP